MISQRFLTIILLLILSSPLISFAKTEEATVFYNEACHHCAVYINEVLSPILEESGVHLTKKDYVNVRIHRQELNELNERLGVPLELQGHIATFIDDKIILGGHVPEHVIRDILRAEVERIVILQDEMYDIKNYKVWAFKCEIKEYPIDTPIHEYLDWFRANKDFCVTPPELLSAIDLTGFFILVLWAGLLDGINPCAFAVLLFLIGVIFTLQRTRGDVFRVGGVYILAIFLIYFLIGLGLFKAIIFAGRFQVVAMIGAYLVIGLGMVNLKDFFFPKLPFKLKIPESKKGTIARWAHKGTLPSAAVLGILVAFYEFPCTGAIYVAVMGLLATKVTFFQGVGFLLLYNLMFVSPLIAILLTASNKHVTQKLDKWRETRAGAMRLLSGGVMITLGLIILIWFV